MTKVSASVLNVDKDNAVHTFYDLETAKIDFFHIDVMDGKFVENNNVDLMKDYAVTLSHISNLGLDVHLMVENVEEMIDEFLVADPERITFHVEAIEDEERVKNIISDLKDQGIKVGMSISPGTDIEKIVKYMPYLHMVLVMTVVPGKGGQSLIPETLETLKALKQKAEELDLDIDFEVDGGIKENNVEEAVDAGANIVVVGTALVYAENPKEFVSKIKSL